MPLPFDEIDTPKSLLDRIEERQLMSYMRLDNAGISASSIRYLMEEYTWGEKDAWATWKWAICYKSGKSWQEIAPIIYEDLV